ncbi:MAG TPA: FAD-binding oxidoreductase, partial [Gaiellaceae bacterium]|nr:FAD-binding oxidoreductase [Gaiellaceae bacterium]
MNETRTSIRPQRELPGFGGQVIRPADPGFDEGRAVFNAMIDRRPALIARCSSPDDVATALGFAREHDLPVAVRGGGHSGGGFGVVDDGLVIDLSLLKTIEIEEDARMVRVGGGCTWGEVDRATHELGLATPSGIISTTGVGGLTLGGGHGYLTRKYGLTIDNLLEAEVVLANGELVRTSEDENPDLFWALRGGGGNFGVVTSFRFRLHAVKTVVAGPVLWPIESTDEVMRWYREFLPNAPRDLYGWLGLHTVPPAPLFPEELHLRRVAFAVFCHLGPAEQAEEALAPVREFGPPLFYGVQELPYPTLQSVFDELYCPGLQWYWRHDFVRELSDEAIERHVEFGRRRPTLHSTMHLYPVDGAAHDVGVDETAFRYRDALWSQVIVGVDPDPARAEELRSFAVDYWEALHPYSAGGGYVNMMMDEGG